MSEIVTDEKVEEALNYLNDNVVDAARASAERVYVEDFKKVIIARLMKESAGFNKTTAAQERDALASDEYQQHLQAIRDAVMDEREHLFRRVAAEAVISAWQTQEASKRAAYKVV